MIDGSAEFKEREELEYRERTAKAAEQFWQEVREYATEHDITFEDARLAVRIMCGSSPWDAWSYVHPEDAQLGVIVRKEKADGVYQQDVINDFVRWAKQRSAELYALDLKAWDWSFKDSEMSLRLLIACSEEQLKQLKGNVTPTISSTMLGAIRELNKMYEYDGANYSAEKARAVIFLHEDALED